MGRTIAHTRTPIVTMPDGTTWTDPEHWTFPESCNHSARAAYAYASNTTDRAIRQAYYSLAMRYTKRAITLARTSAARAQYAAWYRDYWFLSTWNREYLYSTLPTA